MQFLQFEWPNLLYKLRDTPKEKNNPSILRKHSYYLQYSLELIFKRSGKAFLKAGQIS